MAGKPNSFPPARNTDLIEPSYSEFCDSDNRTQTAKFDYCTQPDNLAGVPAASIPVKLSKKSLPLAMQIIGPFGQDMKVIEFCK
jgi:Asp-tRNA(Asn)/Glu-tRNA(Gln) amidotransferase A subunit family amidase